MLRIGNKTFRQLKYRYKLSALIFAFLFQLLGISNVSFSQTKCFANKKGVSFDPYNYFDQKTFDRSLANNISPYDSTDFPINENYIWQMSEILDNIKENLN